MRNIGEISSPPIRRRRGGLTKIFGALLFGVAVVYAVAAVTSPWAFHIGGRWTPLLYWSGSGKLVTKNGSYPLYISLLPSPHGSQLRLDGLRPAGGLGGAGWLCTSPGVIERLSLSGTIYGGWRSTEDSLMEFRLVEPVKTFDTGQRRGYFDLYGRWRGPELVMDDRGRWASTLRNGMKMERASVTFDWGNYSDFKASCANMIASVPRR